MMIIVGCPARRVYALFAFLVEGSKHGEMTVERGFNGNWQIKEERMNVRVCFNCWTGGSRKPRSLSLEMFNSGINTKANKLRPRV